MGGGVGGEAGKAAGIEAAVAAAKVEVGKENPLEMTEAKMGELREKLRAAVEGAAKEAGAKASHEAGLKIDIGAIAQEQNSSF